MSELGTTLTNCRPKSHNLSFYRCILYTIRTTLTMFLQFHRAVCLLFAASAFLWSSASAQSTIAECSLFADGPNATWTHVLTLTTASDAGSADAQSFSINITSLPAEGANYRVFKTTANGSSFFGNLAMSASRNCSKPQT